MSRIKRIIASILPGIFLIGYNVGTGSVTSMSKAGANFGLDLLWTVLASCIVTYYLIVLFSRYTMVTGETAIQGIKKHIHPSVAIILLTALTIIIVSALAGLLGILADVMSVWSETVLPFELSSLFWAIFIGTLVYIVIWIGNYAFFEKILAVLVAIMGLAFVTTMFMNFPSFSDLMKGFVPSIPQVAEGSDNSPFVILAGMVGTTVSVFAFIIRSQIVQDMGWKMSDNIIQKRDAFVSASMMFLISAAVLITASSTLYVQGLSMNNVAEMIPLMEPIAGKAALSVFVIGILAAGLSSHLPNMLVIPWLIIDYKEQERNTKTTYYRIMLFILTLTSILGTALGFKPVFILMLSQACIAIVLPITIGSIFYLTCKRELMNTHVNKIHDVIILSIVMLFSLYVSSLGIEGLVDDLKSIL
ncbi:Nramp family divalent metal transporter [Zobellia galactanivorans]|uniref:Nramp family divalent metal transporter n=1 Tax=Zobellia galactanivorans (strain DSM 12802 / CCUG 47099 / CIP 106680 / NCIMB 13871 / Dsij) TaxID=63186 RepID=UPI0026E19ACA|nr:Nramp family divalent metal transporter [Zobellia galactanivorans]MDO6809955.1 Nramp family divalent metal transporter [Zobellia galactanivorans]